VSDPAAHGPLEGSARLYATFFLALANFMVVLDMTIANVSVPHIAGSLAVSPSQGTWVITSYAVAEAIIVPLTGWLTRRVGTVRLFVFAILGFAASSALCALSGSLAMLVTARVIQGLCGGPIMPLSQTLLLGSYPRGRTGPALAAWSMTTLLAPIAGPVLGGWISDNLAWQWIFYINIPVGIIGSFLIWQIYRNRETAKSQAPVDKVGLFLLIVWVGSLQLVLDKGRELDWFGSPFIVALTCVAAVGFVAFIAWELTDDHPVVDLSLFGNRGFAAAIVAMCTIFAVFFGYVVLMPLWLQSFKGYTAMQAGMAVAPMGFLSILLAPVVAMSMQRVDPRYYATFSVIVFVSVYLWRSQMAPDVTFADIWLPQLVIGLGMSTMFLPMTTIAMAEVPTSQIATAAGLQNFVRTLFGAFGTAIATNYWDNGITRHHAALAETIRNGAPAVPQTTSMLSHLTGTHQGAMALIDYLINQQAAVLAFRDFCARAALVVFCLSPLIWLTHRPKAAVDLSKAH
jgi:MFS transporter, DHA2 family, multidrug resistance protein